MKKITKILLPVLTLTSVTPAISMAVSCGEYNPYVVLPTKHVEALGIPTYAFKFEIKDQGTIYEKVTAKTKVTQKSRQGVTAEVLTAVVSDDNHYITVLVEMSKATGSLRGGDWVEFDLELSCFLKKEDTSADWTTTSKGYKISYKAESTKKLFKYESDGYAGTLDIVGWSDSAEAKEEYRSQVIAANDGVLEFPYEVTKIAARANMTIPTNCTGIKFRSDSMCNSLWGPQDANPTKETPAYPGAFNMSQTWNVSEFVINPAMVHLGNPFEKTTVEGTALEETLVFPKTSKTSGLTIDLSAWTKKNIGRIRYKKTGVEGYFWEWSKNAWYYYKDCEDSVIKVQAGTQDLWKEYFEKAGFKIGKEGEKTYWTFEAA